jgi:uncharacterized protein (DUF58 family)
MKRAHNTDAASGLPVVMLGLVALAAGFHHASPRMAALGLAAAAFPIAVHLCLRSAVNGIRVRREVAETAFEGETVKVKFVLHNGSRLPVFFPVVTEVFPPEIHAQKTAAFPYRVLPGETAEEQYEGDCMLPRGIYGLGPATLKVSDPFGWFHLRKKVAPQVSLKVYPRFQAFGVHEKLGQCLAILVNDLTHFGIGDSNEFFSVRDYRIGDPLRRVHWGLTAHRGYPVVRENTRTAVGDLSIFLDLYRYALLGVGRGSSLEQSVKIAASLAAHALRRGHRVQLFARGKADRSVPPAAGKGHLQAILDALVDVKPDGELPFPETLDGSNRGLPPGSTAVLMVSPYLQESAPFESRLLALRHRGTRVVLVIFDSSTYQSLYDLDTAPEDAARYAARMSALGMEPFIIPCAGNLPAIFEGAGLRAAPAGGGAP